MRGTEWAATGDVTRAAHDVNTLTAAEREAGWELLFDGTATDAWRGYKQEGFPDTGWNVEDGALRVVADGGGGDIITKRAFEDFEFAFQWKVAPGANSGVIYRVSEERGNSWESGPEYQILDDAEHSDADATTTAGALYALYAAAGKDLAQPGTWNRGRILVIGNHVEHWLNGQRVVSGELASEDWKARVAESKFSSMPLFGRVTVGHLALQDHGDDVWYRGLKVRDLSPPASTGKPLFDGSSLAGWTAFLGDGAKLEDVWSVRDGTIVCKGSPAGYLMTEKDYANYVLRLQWRWTEGSEGGNSGVLLRKIGDDKVWPRSIEAQLQSGRAGDFWNIGEYPMRTVSERLNGRNTRHTHANEAAVGEWNEYEITAWHGHVVLRVNGEILNRAWDCMEIPGRIALQSEGAEIHFREITLAPLP